MRRAATSKTARTSRQLVNDDQTIAHQSVSNSARSYMLQITRFAIPIATIIQDWDTLRVGLITTST